MWSAPVTVTPPAGEPVSLAIAKEFLAIEADETLHDAMLRRFIAAARSQAEALTGTRMAPQTVAVTADDWGDLMRLPIGPVTAATHVQWQDVFGVLQTLNLSDYEFTGAELQRGFQPKAGKYWPSGLRNVADAIRVTLAVGYDPLPPALETAILIMVADQFAQRESFVTGTIATKVPTSMQVEQLLGNFRIWL